MDEIKDLLRLLEIEREEDLRQYKNQIIHTPLKDRVEKGWSWYPIKVNYTEIGTGENFYLSLEKINQDNKNHSFQVGDSVSLFSNSREHKKIPSISGVIAAVWKNNMRVSFTIDELPDWVDDPHLGIDLLFDGASYKEMEDALYKVSVAKDDRLAELRDMIFLNQKPSFLTEAEMPGYYVVDTLNDSQNQAVNHILAAKDIAIVHGPPGTGKTTTLVQAVKLTLQNEKQVLVTAPSNTAVDLLTQKLLDKGLHVLRIGNPARMDEELMQYSLEAQIAQHPDFRYLKKLRKEAEEFKKMAHKYKRKFGPEERLQRKLLFAEATQRLNEATVLEKYIIDSLLNEAQVITATLVGTVNKYIRFRRFSTVFIDEAAQALEPACWIPISKSDRVVMAGDHFQLPPTIKSYEAARQGLSQTLFEKIIFKHQVDVMLKVQYRMNEPIMGFSNDQFYGNELIADDSVRYHFLGDNPEDEILKQAVEFIDTAGCSFDEKVHEESQSKFNPLEGDLLVNHLRQLLDQIRLGHSYLLEQGFSIGIISPYNAQVAYLKEHILHQDEFSNYLPFLQVNSIDGFQGQERDVIYISLVRSNTKGQIGFLADTRRMNVALTRARKKLVVIGDSATLGQHGFYKHFLDYMDRIGKYRSAWEYL
ncbi:MAG: AAA domain-containing protein [Microscillaceae bacterium]|nr:AAA domain-containing protein [Microscillaceae bacterium]